MSPDFQNRIAMACDMMQSDMDGLRRMLDAPEDSPYTWDIVSSITEVMAQRAERLHRLASDMFTKTVSRQSSE